MKKLKTLIVVAAVGLTIFSCKNETSPEVKTVANETAQLVKNNAQDVTYSKAEFTIEGMTCAMGCAKTIEKKLGAMDGVKSASVDFNKKLAMVEYNANAITTTDIENTVKKTGEQYVVKEMKTVESFAAKKSCAKTCDKTKKASCANKTEAEKKACAKDCKKACCAGKA